MSLDVLLEPVRVEREPRLCNVGRLVAGLDVKYREAVVEKLAVPFREGGMTDIQLEDMFRRADLPVSATNINRHRRGLCCCA